MLIIYTYFPSIYTEKMSKGENEPENENEDNEGHGDGYGKHTEEEPTL